MGSGGDFTVTVTRKDIVAAVLPILEYWLPLSNLDLLLPPLDVSVFLCYKKPHESVNGGENFTFGSMVRVLKEAMAQALVPYYAFGGEVLSNSLGEPELLCNNHGVDFLEAYADVKLKDLDLYNPDESIEGKLVPKKKHGVLSVQVTLSLPEYQNTAYKHICTLMGQYVVFIYVRWWITFLVQNRKEITHEKT